MAGINFSGAGTEHNVRTDMMVSTWVPVAARIRSESCNPHGRMRRDPSCSV